MVKEDTDEKEAKGIIIFKTIACGPLLDPEITSVVSTSGSVKMG